MLISALAKLLLRHDLLYDAGGKVADVAIMCQVPPLQASQSTIFLHKRHNVEERRRVNGLHQNCTRLVLV